MTTLSYRIPLSAEIAPRSRLRLPGKTVETRLLMGAHEALLGRKTFAIARGLADSQFWQLDRLNKLRLEKLRQLFDHARAHCPFYAGDRLPPGASIAQLDDLPNVGLLTREDVRRESSHMSWRNMPHKKMPDRTRGTTNNPLTYYWDRNRQAWDKANRLRGRGWQGLHASDRELHFWPFDPPVGLQGRVRQWLRNRRDELFGEIQIDSLSAAGYRVPLIRRAWRRFDPVCVTSYPSALAELILEGRRLGAVMGNPALRRVCLTGEVTYPWQRKLIETQLGATVSEDYGIQEAGALAFTCASGRWHVSAESAIIELIRHGRPARDGELGELVVTGLESRAMPMIRYCSGDIVRAENSTCDCGLGLPVIPPVLGRAADFLEADTGDWVEPARVLASLGEVLENGHFQVVQDGDGGVEVRVVSPRDVSGRVQRGVCERVDHLLGRRAACTIRPVPSLQRTFFGKCRYVHSARTGRGLAVARSGSG
jgi:phenylacetate-CoA ligase